MGDMTFQHCSLKLSRTEKVLITVVTNLQLRIRTEWKKEDQTKCTLSAKNIVSHLTDA